mgnify:CR=1 FL=1
MSSPEHKQKIWNIIKDIKVGMLVTLDGDDLRGRPMYLVQDEYDGTIWFYTHKSAEKISEIQNKHKVCLTFYSDKKQVSLSGHAHLTTDAAQIDKYWNPFAAAWFAHGREDPDVAMLEVKIYQGEHWETDNKVKQLYEVGKANMVDGETPEMGQNQKFG